jgi:alkylation response protein AidB-like acyl-CoA dehydrogenase/crotonobetainyl-CoA:carnitine CoA-transferase CaiB-like acyl-CoA transferase
MNRDNEAPLAGLRIIEVSSFVAAPLGGMTLAQLGAEVIRVDPPGGAADTTRWPLSPDGASLYWTGLNKGKRSVTLDFRSDEGRQALQDLIAGSGDDGGIVLTNAAFDWLSYDVLQQIRPDLIHLLITGRHDGGPAVDYTVNASLGFPFATGPEEISGPVNHVLPAWDVATGLYAATGILAAERHRRRTGRGRAITLPLADVALAVTGHLGFLAEAQLGAGEGGGGRPRIGNHLYGGFARDFRTAGGEIMVCLLTDRHFRDLAAATGLSATFAELAKALSADFSTDSDRYRHREVLAALLQPWFAQRTVAEVATAFAGTSVLWERYRTFAELAADPKLLDNPLVQIIDQPGVGQVLATGSPLAQPGVEGPVPAPVLGADTETVLGQVPGHLHETELSGSCCMRRLTETDGLTEFQRDILRTVREFVDAEVIPVATELDHRDTYPDTIVERLKDLGVFGLTIAEEYGGLGEGLLTYALVVEELSRGWMSLSGIINTHFMVAYLISAHGTQEQKEYFLPKMATGQLRSALSMSEPGLGSDVAAIRTTARRDGDDYVLNGQKMWLTNGGSSNVVLVLVRTDEGAAQPHKNLTAFLVEKDPGFGQTRPGLTVPGKIHKMGYHGVDTTELLLSDCRVPSSRVLGGETGHGFYQLMDGIELGRVNVAARGCGVALRAFELGVRYSKEREAFGKIIGEHQGITFKLAEMATKVTAAHQMMVMAARRKEAGGQSDVEAGMAKYLSAEYCKEVVEDSLRIHGGYGYSTEHEIERLYRDAPMLLIGEGTAEIQKMVIGRRLVRDYDV